MLRKKNIIIVLMVCILLIGCSKEDENFNIDINDAAKKLVENIKFEDSLELIDSEIINMYYEMPQNTNGVLYMGSGATAEELAIFELDDKNRCEEMIEMIKAHIENQIIQFENYDSEEIKKLENYILEIYDNYIIICITDDVKNAGSEIKNYMK